MTTVTWRELAATYEYQLNEERRVRRQLAEALRFAASSLSDEWEEMRHSALDASDALEEKT